MIIPRRIPAGVMVPLTRRPFTATSVTNDDALPHIVGPIANSGDLSIVGSVIYARCHDTAPKYLSFMLGHHEVDPNGFWFTFIVRGVRRILYRNVAEHIRYPLFRIQVKANTGSSFRQASLTEHLTEPIGQMDNRRYASTVLIVNDYTGGTIRRIGESDDGICLVNFDSRDSEFIEIEGGAVAPQNQSAAEAGVVFGSGFVIP